MPLPFLVPNQQHHILSLFYEQINDDDDDDSNKARKQRRFHIDSKVHCEEAHPLCGSLSLRGLNPIKLAYDPSQQS